LSSSAVRGGRLPAKYTCDGSNVPPPLQWGPVPAGLNELVLFALASPVTIAGQRSVPVVWAMAGLSPKLRGVRANEVPNGAYIEEASDGQRHYSICPPDGTTERYRFALYALPPQFAAGTAIDGPHLLHNLTEQKPEFLSPIRGEMSVVYTRST
jgi:phosphatidylethanolamine-binding protein (PEBP) family uncharacterized protein